MKNQNLKFFGGIAIAIVFSSVTIGKTMDRTDASGFFSLKEAFAQRLDLGLTPGHGGGGSTGCSGAVCSSANGYNYSTFTQGDSSTCCGIASTTGGKQSN